MICNEHHSAVLYSWLEEPSVESIGPCETAGECIVRVCELVNGPSITVTKLELRRIGLWPEEKADGWHLNLDNAAQLVALAWGDDETDWMEETE